MNKYYVYLHITADTNRVFYVGKGHDGRAESKAGRSKWWHRTVNKHGFYVEYFKTDLSEAEAFSIESELINKYGRINVGTGVLINMTDGGEGCSGRTTSQKTRDKISKSNTGKNHFSYDPTIYKWVNKNGDVIFKTIQEITKEYGIPGGLASRVISGVNRAASGWFHDCYKVNRTKFNGQKLTGKDHPMYNAKIYKWIRADGATEHLTKYDMQLKHGVKVSDLCSVVSGKQKSAKGWFLNCVKDITGNRYRKLGTTAHHWVYADGKKEYLSINEMILKYGTNKKALLTVISGRNKSHMGWFFETIKKTNVNQHNRAYR